KAFPPSCMAATLMAALRKKFRRLQALSLDILSALIFLVSPSWTVVGLFGFRFANVRDAKMQFFLTAIAQAMILSAMPPDIWLRGSSRANSLWGKPGSMRLASSNALSCPAESERSRLARLSLSCESLLAPMIGMTGTD